MEFWVTARRPRMKPEKDCFFRIRGLQSGERKTLVTDSWTTSVGFFCARNSIIRLALRHQALAPLASAAW